MTIQEPTAKGKIPDLPPVLSQSTKPQMPIKIPVPTTAAHISLTGESTISQRRTESLSAYFQDHLALPSESKEALEEVFKRCLEEYQKSVNEYEAAVGRIAFHDPQAKAYAQEYCRRMAAIVTAYNAVLEDENPSVEKNLLFTKEFMQLMRIGRIFGNISTQTGSVGMNPLVISKALIEGNLREQMTLLYCTVFSFLIPEILAKQDMIDKINLKLASLPENKRFQIDKALVEKEKKEGTGVVESHGTFELKQCREVDVYRNIEKGRVPKKMAPPSEGPQGPLVSEVQDLSLREQRAGSEFSEAKRLSWIPGKNWYDISSESSFYKELSSLGQLPVVTGPSGSTDGILHIAKYVGLGDHPEHGVLALAGWMIPASDHSLHEIRVAARNYGIPYSGQPSDFETLCAHNPAASAAIEKELASKNIKNPSYYFSAEYQLKVFHDIIKEKRAQEYNDHLEKLLLEASAQVGPIPDLKNLDEPQEVKDAVRGYNEQLRKLEQQVIVLSEEREELEVKGTKVEDQPAQMNAVKAKLVIIRDQYHQTNQKKIDYVKAKVSAQNQVYAMAIQRELPSGTHVYTAFNPQKAENLLLDDGEGFFLKKWSDPGQPATCYGTGFDPSKGAFGANEMGEIGHYFSVGSPAYLIKGKMALHFKLKENVAGASIMSVTELASQKFTGDQIEAGYKKLQKEFPFIQNFGLPPKDTEVVFLKPYSLGFQEIMFGNGPNEITGKYSIETYEEDILCNDPPRKLHTSWTTPPSALPPLKAGHTIQDVVPPSTSTTKIEPPQISAK